jgi:hypothetical protein
MDTVTLNITFEDEIGMKIRMRLNDIRADVTSADVLKLANKLIEDNTLINKGRSIEKFVSAEKVSIERLD